MSTMIKRGSRGPNVIEVQQQLNTAADITFSRHDKLVPDGIFGRKTKARVEEFQALHGLAVDGIVGPNTWAALFGPTKPFPGGGGADRSVGARAGRERREKEEVSGRIGRGAPSYSSIVASESSDAGGQDSSRRGRRRMMMSPSSVISGRE